MRPLPPLIVARLDQPAARFGTSMALPSVHVALIGCLAMTALLLFPGPALSGGAKGTRLKSNVSKSDDAVSIVVRVTSGPDAPCFGTARKGGRKINLPALITGAGGDGQWSWQIAPGVPAGTWRVTAKCTRSANAVQHAEVNFVASGGGGRGHGGGLYVRKTLKQHAVGAQLAGGNGAGDRSLYPRGQCTWYVAVRRPDLPYFPGKSGDALRWITSAKRSDPPLPTGEAPAVGAVAVFQPGQYEAGKYGHVAYVEAVNRDKITVSEANYRHRRQGSKRQIAWRGLRFIYAPPPPAPPPLPPAPPPAPPLPPLATLLVSGGTGLAGAVSNSDSSGKAVSSNARYVAFDSAASNLDPADTDSHEDVFLRDTQGGSTTLVSRATGASGAKANGPSWSPDVSSDGRYVTFVSSAPNLVGGDTKAAVDVFVRDLDAGTTTLVSRATGATGTKGDGESTDPAISSDGRYVTFVSSAANLVGGDTNAATDVFVRDLDAGTTTLVSRASGVTGTKGDGESADPAISNDGRHVAFGSSAANLVDGDTNGADVFVRDLEAATTTLVSRASGVTGAKGDGDSASPDISGNGRHVTFDSHASNLDLADTDAILDVFVRDLSTGATMLVSRAYRRLRRPRQRRIRRTRSSRTMDATSASTRQHRTSIRPTATRAEMSTGATFRPTRRRSSAGPRAPPAANGNQDAFSPAISAAGAPSRSPHTRRISIPLIATPAGMCLCATSRST